MHRRGWAPGTGGNFSVVVARDPLRLLITRSGCDKRRVAWRDDLLLVDATGALAIAAAGRPSAETRVHCAVAERAAAGAVLHTHSVAATLLGEHFLARGGLRLENYEMLKGLEGITTHEADVYVPVVENTQDMAALADEVGLRIEAQPALRGLLVAGHGLYAWGATLEQAERHVEVFEFLFECAARRTSFVEFRG